MGFNRNPDCTDSPEQASHKIDKCSGQLSSISLWEGERIMVKVVYEGDDFKRMHRTDMLALQRIVDAKKLGIHEIKYKESTIKVEIKKKGDAIVVKRWRAL
jgi:hypothetical protein